MGFFTDFIDYLLPLPEIVDTDNGAPLEAPQLTDTVYCAERDAHGTVEIRERDGKYEVWQDVFEGKQATPLYRKVKSSRNLNTAKKFALALAPKVSFGHTDFYRA
jgi:hypothetical protein